MVRSASVMEINTFKKPLLRDVSLIYATTKIITSKSGFVVNNTTLQKFKYFSISFLSYELKYNLLLPIFLLDQDVLHPDEPTAPTVHSARLVSGPAPFLERIGTRSQDSLNEGSFAEKVTCFPINTHCFSTKWRCSLAVKVQRVCPVRSGFA